MRKDNSWKSFFTIFGGGLIEILLMCILSKFLPPIILLMVAVFICVINIYAKQFFQKYYNNEFKKEIGSRFDVSNTVDGCINNDNNDEFYKLYNPRIKDKEQVIVEQIKKKHHQFSNTSFKQKSIAYFKMIQTLESSFDIDNNIIMEIKNSSIVASFIINYSEKQDYEYIGLRVTTKHQSKEKNTKDEYNNYYIEFKRNKKIRLQYNKKIVDVECKFCGASVNITKNNKCPYCHSEISIDGWSFDKVERWEGDL